MFCIKLIGDCDPKRCFEVPVKVRMPMPGLSSNDCGQCGRGTFRLYRSRDGVWADSSANNFRTFDSAGKVWMEFYADCPMCYNADCCIDFNAGKTKVKVKGIDRLEKVEMTTECPVGVLRYFSYRGKRKIIARFPCYEKNTNMKISATGFDKEGNIMSSSQFLIGELKHSWGKRKCRPDEKMGKKTKKGKFYKKYIIRI
jgi:hypothetical protein